MQIYQDNIVRSQVHPGFRRSQKPTTIVIHGTAGGAPLDWFRYGSKRYPHLETAVRHKRGVGLTHYLISTDGKITEIYDPATRWVYHSSSGNNDAKTIGIELENKSKTNANAYTQAQYFSLASLIHFLESKFGFMEETTHNAMKRKFTGTGKNCPGQKFSFASLQKAKAKTNSLMLATKKILHTRTIVVTSVFLVAGIYTIGKKRHGNN